MATCPGCSAPLPSGVYVMLCPAPEGTYAEVPTLMVCPFQSAVMFTGEVHVFATNMAKQPPSPSAMMSGSTA